jgi:DNA mismatch endonuclease (patch repair protein)
MLAQRRRDTTPEMRLRREVHRRGLRFRVDAPLPLPDVRRKADLLFTRRRVAVFVDGCFWHVCPVHGSSPKSNTIWWQEKLSANVARDRDTDRRLVAAGWVVIRIWEHEDPLTSADLVEKITRTQP